MSLRLLSDVEREVLLDALSEYLDVDSDEERAEMEADGEWLSTAERLYTAVEDGAMALDEADQ